MPFTTSTSMHATLLLMGAIAVPASPITSSSPQPAFTSVSSSICPTTVVTFPALVVGPTSTVYTHTSTVTSKYDCHGCDGLVVVQLGHNFLEKVSYTTTITEYRPTTYIQAVCSSTSENVQTESITMSSTETAGYTTVTFASKIGDSLPAEVEERQVPEVSVTGTEDCTSLCKFIINDPNPPGGTGLSPTPVDLATCIAECLVASREKLIPGSELEQRQTSQCVQCPSHGRLCYTVDCPTTQKCVECPADGGLCFSVDCAAAKRAINDKIKRRETSQCVYCPTDGGLCVSVDCPPTQKCVYCPADGGLCISVDCAADKRADDDKVKRGETSQCVQCPADGGLCISVDCDADRRAVDDDEIKRREIPQCKVCLVNSGDTCFEVNCPVDPGNEGQRDKRGFDPTRCYNLCISRYSEPFHQEMHRCRLDCTALGPVYVGDECPAILRAADTDTEIEVEERKRQGSLYGHPGTDQDDGCHFEGGE